GTDGGWRWERGRPPDPVRRAAPPVGARLRRAAGRPAGRCSPGRRGRGSAIEKHVNAIFTKLDLGESPEVDRRVAAVLRFLQERDLQ
ncbi:MAG TPA: hypothetical protein VGP53_00150, partial [Acidimicrobiales bacterium]|nr:hypothetical protein [Acidimicrobiales bacterium]